MRNKDKQEIKNKIAGISKACIHDKMRCDTIELE